MDVHKGMKPTDVAALATFKPYLIMKHRFNGAAVVYGRIRDWDPKEFTLLEIQKAFVFGAEHYADDVGIQRHGLSGIADFSGLRFEHLWQATIKEVVRAAEVGQVSSI